VVLTNARVGVVGDEPIELQGRRLGDARVPGPTRADAEPVVVHAGELGGDVVELLAPQGKIGLIDDPAAPLDVMQLKRKSLSLHWELMFTRSLFQTADMQRQHELLNRVADLVDAGRVRSTLAQHFGTITAANLRRAHAQIESGTTLGKIVLEGF
jgi:NADPH:quinone reductase-like Zn-dependent oxidoreductase